MSPPAPRRVHIAPVGYEDSRIYLPAEERGAEIVVLLRHSQNNPRADACLERAVEGLHQREIDTEEAECDFFDLGSSLDNILSLVSDYPNDHVEINLSSGSKITAIAGIIATMIEDAEPYYAKPDGYLLDSEDSLTEFDEDFTTASVTQGLEEIITIPSIPGIKPNCELIKILRFIQQNQPASPQEGVQKIEVNRFALEEDMGLVATTDKTADEADEIYDLTNREIFNPLSERDYIEFTSTGPGRGQIRITKRGENLVEIGPSICPELS